MAKSTKPKKASKPSKSVLPLAPVIYVNNSIAYDLDVARALAALIPNSTCSDYDHSKSSGEDTETLTSSREAQRLAAFPDATHLPLFPDLEQNVVLASQSASRYCEAAIKLQRNFASVNLIDSSLAKDNESKKAKWGANHLEVDMAGINYSVAAKKIFEWLFQVLTVPETLHLISATDMSAADTKSFPDYTYCPIAETRNHPKDAKIQFVALIETKPQVGADNKLHWKVVDRSGRANFYFQYRGPESQVTWDWVLRLQPGDRKVLPRMPMVLIKEKKRVKILKAPFRGVAAVVSGTGSAVKDVGKGLCWIGERVKLGPSGGQWIPEEDVGKDGKVKANVKPTVKKVGVVGHTTKKKEMKTLNEKGETTWKGEDDLASTRAESFFDEKMVEKEFF